MIWAGGAAFNDLGRGGGLLSMIWEGGPGVLSITGCCCE